MKHVNTKLKIGLLSLIIAGSSMYTAQSHALYRYGYYFDNLWQELDRWDEHMRIMHNTHTMLKQDLQQEEELLRQPRFQRIIFPQVKTVITQDEKNVIIKIIIEQNQEDGKQIAELINQQDVDVQLQGKNIIVTIPVKHGKVELIVNSSAVKVIKSASINKEQTKNTYKESMNAYTSSFTVHHLPHLVSIKKETAGTVKALVKDNVLTLVLPKQSKTKIPVTLGSHDLNNAINSDIESEK